MEGINEFVGGRIRTIRKGKKMSIQQLADTIHKSKACVSKYEKGEITVDIPTLFEIASALEVLPERLINYEVKPKIEVGSALGGTSSFFKASSCSISSKSPPTYAVTRLFFPNSSPRTSISSSMSL